MAIIDLLGEIKMRFNLGLGIFFWITFLLYPILFPCLIAYTHTEDERWAMQWGFFLDVSCITGLSGLPPLINKNQSFSLLCNLKRVDSSEIFQPCYIVGKEWRKEVRYAYSMA